MNLSTPVIIALYWEQRAASAEEAAQQLLVAFHALEDAGLERWFQKTRARRDAESTPFTPSADTILALLRKGVNRRDIDRSIIEELGFSMSLWSGGQDEAAYSLSTHIGCVSPHVGNNFVVQLPATGPFALQTDLGKTNLLFHKLIQALRPKQGIVCAAEELEWHNNLLSPDIRSLARYTHAA